MERIWILVADSAHARVYLRGKRWDQLEQLEQREHPEGRGVTEQVPDHLTRSEPHPDHG